MWVQSLGGIDPLGNKMATHSSVLAWKTAWSEESGRLQSIGSQRSDMTEYACLQPKVPLKKYSVQSL